MKITLKELRKMVKESIFTRHFTGQLDARDIIKAVKSGELNGHSFRDVSLNVVLGGITESVYFDVSIEKEQHSVLKVLSNPHVRDAMLYVRLIGDMLIIQ